MAGDGADAYGSALRTLRETDFDRYLACLLMPEDKRGPIAALYAFNAELARVRDMIHEPLPGEIRLQWWRDLLENGAPGEAQANPLAAALLRAVEDFRLPRAPLVTMTEARIFDLYDDPMPDRGAFELYAGETAAALLQMTGLVLDPERAPSAADASGHGGIAQLVAGSMLLMPLHRRRGQLYLPQDILAATGLERKTFLAGEKRKQISAALEAFIGFGRDHLRKARQAASTLDKPLVDTFLPLANCAAIFDRAEKEGADVLERVVQPSQVMRQWRLWRASRRGRF